MALVEPNPTRYSEWSSSEYSQGPNSAKKVNLGDGSDESLLSKTWCEFSWKSPHFTENFLIQIHRIVYVCRTGWNFNQDALEYPNVLTHEYEPLAILGDDKLANPFAAANNLLDQVLRIQNHVTDVCVYDLFRSIVLTGLGT